MCYLCVLIHIFVVAFNLCRTVYSPCLHASIHFRGIWYTKLLGRFCCMWKYRILWNAFLMVRIKGSWRRGSSCGTVMFPSPTSEDEWALVNCRKGTTAQLMGVRPHGGGSRLSIRFAKNTYFDYTSEIEVTYSAHIKPQMGTSQGGGFSQPEWQKLLTNFETCLSFLPQHCSSISIRAVVINERFY